MIDSDYYELLKHPKWQRKRLEIMSRDGWKCTECGDTETELHVHHLEYIYGRDPWEYPDENLETLCKNHHKKQRFAKVEKTDEQRVGDKIMAMRLYKELKDELNLPPFEELWPIRRP